MNQEDLNKALEALVKSGITVAGDLVLKKNVEYEVNNVEKGGIGIQIINGRGDGKDDDDMNVDEDDNQDDNDGGQEDEELNYFQPQKHLQLLLNGDWFKEIRTDEKYDESWIDDFLEALMNSEYGEGIARDWSGKESSKRSKRPQIKAQVIGALVGAGVLNGGYDTIAKKVGVMDNPRTFGKYMSSSNGRRAPYYEWVKEYVKNN